MLARRSLAAAALLPALPVRAQQPLLWTDLLAPMPEATTLADTAPLFALARLPPFLRGADSGVLAVPLPQALVQALADPAGVFRATGLRLPLVRHVAAFGEPPRQFLHLLGPPEMDLDMPGVLQRRGFTRSEEAGAPVFAIGNDGSGPAVSRGNAADPFGGMLGMPQRLLLNLGRVLAAPDWPGLRASFAALRDPDARNRLSEVLADSLELIERLLGAPTGAALRQAVGHALPVFAGSAARRMLEALARGEAPTGGGGPNDLPVFAAAILGSADLAQGPAAFAAALYDDPDDAAEAAEEIVRRLAAPDQMGSGEVPSGVAAVHGGENGLYAAVAVARFIRPAPADAALGHWLQLVHQGDFTPLELDLSGGNR